MKSTIQKLTHFSSEKFLSNTTNHRERIMEIFRIFGIPALVVFSIDDILNHDYRQAIITSTILVVFILSYPIQKKITNPICFSRFGMGLLVLNFIYILITSDNLYISLLWLLLVPVIVAFLLETKEAITWIIATGVIASLLVYVLMPQEKQTLDFFGRFIFLYGVIGALSITSDYIRKISQIKYLEAQEELTNINKKISLRILKDPLTNAYNREFLSDNFSGLINYARNNNAPLSIILWDIDFFKDINDTKGHLVGDQILVEATMICKTLLRRNTDNLIRYGGDEFLLILQETTLEEASKIAERLRRKIEAFEFKQLTSPINGSFGVAQLAEKDFVDGADSAITKLMSRADKCLYRAKKNGRNLVISDSYPRDP